MPADSLAPQAHYRRDIDGLRAFAILPVVFYHYGVPGFSGGFVGVDIFFVISGYLITGVLTSADRPIGFATFYARRIRRLLPALAAVLMTTTVAALILLPPSALVIYGGSLASVGVAGSNVFFWRTLASYFAASGENHPLLHTWSLAVEEQFYFLFPVVLRLLDRLGNRARFAAIALACLASLILAAWFAPRAPSASFYLLPTRAWELLAGGTLSLVRLPAKPTLATVLGLIGLALIAFAVVTFGPQSQVPGIAAVIPCLGALLLIQIGAASPANPVSRLISAPPLVGIGLISYALYLWHWPINVFLRRYVLFDAPPAWMVGAEIAVAVGAATLSWFLIERPLRHGAALKTPTRAFLFAAALSALTIAAGMALYVSNGLPNRFPGLAAVAMQQEPTVAPTGPHGPFMKPENPASGWLLTPGEGQQRRVLVWGDSYARHLLPGFAKLGMENNLAVFQHVENACPPVIDYEPASLATCHGQNQAALAIIRDDHIDTVVLAGRWDSYASTGKLKLDRIADTVRQLRGMGLTVVLVGQPPTYGFDNPAEYHERRVRAGDAKAADGAAVNLAEVGTNQRLGAAVGDALFDPTPVFCRQLCTYRRDGRYLVSDVGHLTPVGSEMLVGALLTSPAFQPKTDRP